MFTHRETFLQLLASWLVLVEVASGEGPCQSMGFTSCCSFLTNVTCYSSSANCYCDKICYFYKDCCSDVADIGCIVSITPTATSLPATNFASCVDGGFSGCCNPNEHPTCQAQPVGDEESCFCDQVCYQYGDCCPDVGDIGCYASSSIPQATPAPGSCLEAGFHSCCDPNVAVNCFGYPPTCYCDEICYDFGDCCGDVTQAGCIAPSVQPTADHGSCAGLGYAGCCVPSQDEQCLGDDGECYCDINCHYFGDCCDDVEEIGCSYPTAIPEEGSCVAAEFQECCNPLVSIYCFGLPPVCYCDELCYEYGDCCADIEEIGCIAPSILPTIETNGSCADVGYTDCCLVSNSDLCLGSDGFCHCHAECYDDGDCCPDVDEIGCTSPSPSIPGSCKLAGFTQCCNTSTEPSCLGNPQTCYCDQICYYFDDCCDDLKDICQASTTNTNTSTGSCTQAGFTSGCCNLDVSSNCHGSPPDCWCDAECYDYGNCCKDIHYINCYEAPGSCISAGYASCCPGEQDTCLGKPANCFCDQLCAINNNCCGDIDQLSNCDLPTVPTTTVPGAVQNMKIRVINSSAVAITWDDPAKPNGAFLYYIKVQQWNGQGKKPVTVISYSASHNVTVTGLKGLVAYNGIVWAVNTNGNGKRVKQLFYTVQGAPTVGPSDVTITRNNATSIRVSWTLLDPDESQGFVDNYTVYYQPEGYSGAPHYVTVGGGTNRIDLLSLQPGVLYSVAVQGSTVAGAGPISDFVSESYETSMTYAYGTSTTPTPGKQSTGLNVGLVVGGVFGVAAVLIVAIVAALTALLIYTKMSKKHSAQLGSGYKKLMQSAINEGADDDDDE